MTDPGLVEERRQFNTRIRDLEQRHAALLDVLDTLVQASGEVIAKHEHDFQQTHSLHDMGLHRGKQAMRDALIELLRQHRTGSSTTPSARRGNVRCAGAG